MKKSNLLILFLCLSVIFTGCNKGKSDASADTGSTPKKETVKTKAKKSTISAIALYDGTPLYIENDDGKMVYNDEVQIGETLLIYMADNAIEQKEAIRLLNSGKEETFNFIHVSYYENDYWTRDIFITNDKTLVPGIITSDTLTYNEADGTTATSKKLSEGTIVAVNEASKTKDADFDIEFVAVSYYNGAAFGKEVYVKAETVSSNAADLLAWRTLSKLKANENLKPEISEKIMSMVEELPLSQYMTEQVIKASVGQ